MTYKIILKNKTNSTLFYKIKDCSNESKLLKILKNETKTEYLDTTVSNLFIYSEDQTIEWEGSIPTNTDLEIFEKDGKINVYLDGNKIPSYLIKNYNCKKRENCSYFGCNSLIISIIFLFLLILFIYLFYSNKKR